MAWFNPDELQAALDQSFEESGLSQSELARRMGWDRRRVNELLAGGRKNLTPDVVAEAMTAMGYRLQLYVGHDEKPPVPPDLTEAQRRLLGDVLRSVAAIPDDQVDVVRAVFARFAGKSPLDPV